METDLLGLSMVRKSKSADSSPERLSPPLVPRSPSMPWEPLALPLFVNFYTTFAGTGKYQGLMSFVPGLYSQSSPDSCLHLAISAAADANAVRKLTDTRAMYQARAKYLAALNAAQRAIQDPVDALRDSTLCCLFMLTIFEVRGW